ncbi:MAG: YccF domain-containing protein [Asticcacaulis sp.]|uniref:YccF domain-containing protein n=1 Tax=Asticcacaulis sp. TaxID=1872648 RepID=UPI003F7C3216
MTLLLNILWFIFGGFISGCLWLLGGLILACTIVGLPWAFSAWRIASFVFWPFGRRIVDRPVDPVSGCLGVFLNIIWFVFAGWYIALAHVLIAIPEAISIIGVPFAFKDLQLAQLALAPVGKEIVSA